MYFKVKSCIHTVQWPQLHQNMPYLSPYHRPVPNCAKLRENIEIPRKWANSAARLKILHSAENCGPQSSSWRKRKQAFRGPCIREIDVESQTLVTEYYSKLRFPMLWRSAL